MGDRDAKVEKALAITAEIIQLAATLQTLAPALASGAKAIRNMFDESVPDPTNEELESALQEVKGYNQALQDMVAPRQPQET